MRSSKGFGLIDAHRFCTALSVDNMGPFVWELTHLNIMAHPLGDRLYTSIAHCYKNGWRKANYM